jgi:hypothetical protein
MTKKNGSKKRDAKRRLVRFYKFQLLRLKLIEKKKSMLMPITRLESQPQRLKMIGSIEDDRKPRSLWIIGRIQEA